MFAQNPFGDTVMMVGGAITSVEPDVQTSDTRARPKFGTTDPTSDFASANNPRLAYQKAMLKKYGSEEWQQLQGQAERLQSRLSKFESRFKRGQSTKEKIAGLRAWRKIVSQAPPEVVDVLSMNGRLGFQGYDDLAPQWDVTQEMISQRQAATKPDSSNARAAVRRQRTQRETKERQKAARAERLRATRARSAVPVELAQEPTILTAATSRVRALQESKNNADKNRVDHK
jgi:hypothetical protein